MTLLRRALLRATLAAFTTGCLAAAFVSIAQPWLLWATTP